MLSRDRLFFIAVGGFLALGLLYAGSVNEHRKASGGYERAANTDANTSQQQDETSQLERGLPFDRQVSPASADQKASKSQSYSNCELESVEQCDLATQQSMAQSTVSMMHAAWFGAIFTAIGVILLWKTLEATRAAVAKAGEGNRVAQWVAETTERIGQAQVRAYIQVTDVRVQISEDMSPLSEGGRPLQMQLTLRNSGQSPALNPEAVIKFDFLETPGSDVAAKHGVEHRHAWAAFPLSESAAGETYKTDFISSESVLMREDVWGVECERLESVSASIVIFAEDVFGTEITDLSDYHCIWNDGVSRKSPQKMVKRPNLAISLPDEVSRDRIWEHSLHRWRRKRGPQ